MIHQYRVFTLILSSEVELPELPDAVGQTDISVTFGVVPRQLESAAISGVLFQATLTDYLLTIPKVARYQVTDGGSRIIVDPETAAPPRDLRRFLLDYALSAALRQRGLMVLHGSAIAAPSGAVVFAGVSGAGKSTLLAHMIDRGYSMLADDMAAISFANDGTPAVLPGQPYLKMFPDTLGHLGRSAEGLPTVRTGGRKLLASAVGQCSPTPVPLAAVCELHVSNVAEIAVTRLRGQASVEVIRRMTRAVGTWEALSQHAELLRLAIGVATKARVFRISRPMEPFMLQALGDRIVQDIL